MEGVMAPLLSASAPFLLLFRPKLSIVSTRYFLTDILKTRISNQKLASPPLMVRLLVGDLFAITAK